MSKGVLHDRNDGHQEIQKKQNAAYPFPGEPIDRLLVQVDKKDAERILGESGLAGQLKLMLAEHVLSAELNYYLANEK